MSKPFSKIFPGLKRYKIGIGELDGRVVRQTLGDTFYVNPQAGDDSRDGNGWASALESMAEVFTRIKSGDRILVAGNVTEELTAPAQVFDVAIIGAANRPRHADDARDGIGARPTGATWRQAASHGASTPLLKLRRQGWHIENLLMVPPTDAGAIRLVRDADSGEDEQDASHAEIVGVRFAGTGSTEIGIEDDGGHFNVLVEGCTFHHLTDGIKTLNTAVAVPLAWEVLNNRFFLNAHAIRASAAQWLIKGNSFGSFSSAPNIDLSFIAGNDAAELANVVTGNLLSGAYNNTNYIEGAGNTDEWGGNFNVIAGGVTAAQP